MFVEAAACGASIDQREAFVRLVGETTEKMTFNATPTSGRSTATVSARYAGPGS